MNVRSSLLLLLVASCVHCSYGWWEDESGILSTLWNTLLSWLFPPPTPSVVRCGCRSCSESVWDTSAVGATCGERIDYLQSQYGLSETDACTRVGNIEYANECGSCDPTQCDGQPPPPVPSFHCGCETCNNTQYRIRNTPNTLSCEARVTFLRDFVPGYNSETDACRRVAAEADDQCRRYCDPETCRPLELYCFPPNRTTLQWTDDYQVQIKESGDDTTCGPGNNRFATETVTVNDDSHLQLSFRQVNNLWTGSEVRILPLDQSPFSYGTYTFVVDSIQVRDASTNAVLSNHLPVDLVLGLFVWDDTDDFSIKENYNHEVDVEVAQWGDPTNPDLQFVVQPWDGPGDLQIKRFWSDNSAETLDQHDLTLRFTWNPGQIDFAAQRNGETLATHSYTTQEALSMGFEDYVQCLPASLDVRINLWSIGAPPPDNAVVVATIRDFQYEASTMTSLDAGETCSKDCQCSNACTSGVCD